MKIGKLSTYRPISIDIQNYIACLRGFAILTIVFGHVGGYWAFQPYSSYLHATGSTFFYFLSGAVLYHSYCRSKSIYVYFVKRFSSLLVPYYLICLISILVYFVNNKSIPHFDIGNLVAWLLIEPKNEIMPFPLGQLWFLHTYVLLFLISPLIFILYDKSIYLLITLYLIIIFISFIKLYCGTFFDLKIINLEIYNLLYYSVFFTYGIFLYSGQFSFPDTISKSAIILSPLFTFLLINKDPNIAASFDNRDILAVLVTFVVAGFSFVFKDKILNVIIRFKFIFTGLKFYHVNTFSVYLLHTLSIYFSERFFGLVNPPVKSICYGLTKFIVVLLICSLLSIPFTKLSKKISQWLVFKIVG
jgi:peptidoglycan/LPS O-acetylase OafA/YrhL